MQVLRSDPLTTTLAAVTVLLLLLYHRPLIVAVVRRTLFKSQSDDDGTALPPKAQTSIRAFLAAFFSRDAPLYLLDHSRRTGSIFRLPVGPGCGLVVLGEAEAARAVLDDPKSAKTKQPYRLFDMVAGARESFFTSDGFRWKHVRKATAVAFAPSQMERMRAIIRSQLDDFIRITLGPLVKEGESFDVDVAMQRVTTKVIVEAGFEYRMDDGELDMFLLSFQLAYREYGRDVAINPLRRVFPWAFPGSRRAMGAVRSLRSFARRLLEEYRRNKTNGVASGTVVAAIDGDESYDSDEERVADIIVFLAGGFDTTAHTLAWALLELARNPIEQEYLYRELKSSTSSDANGAECKALQNVVRETLRLHAAAAMGSVRTTTSDVKVGKYIVPEGTWVMIPYFVVHRNEEVFEAADSFRPRRWKGQSNARPSPNSILPFASGRRNCLGQALASAELSVILSTLCRAFEFSVVEEGRYDFFVTWKTVGTRLLAKRRE